MACCLLGAKPLSEPMLEYYYLDPKEQISWNFTHTFYSYIFIKENAFESVICEMVAICLTLNVLINGRGRMRKKQI